MVPEWRTTEKISAIDELIKMSEKKTTEKVGTSQPLWELTNQEKQQTALWRFALYTQKWHGAEPQDYVALHNWSVEKPEQFYAALWDFLSIEGEKGTHSFIGHSYSSSSTSTSFSTSSSTSSSISTSALPSATCLDIPSNKILEAQFYPDAKLNYAENLLQGVDDSVAIISYIEDGTRRVVTKKQLYDQVSKMVQALKRDGVVQDDRVAAIVTNDIEAIVGYLAVSAIGAIWACCSPDFGPIAASDRLCQVKPKVLLAYPSYKYGGKAYDVTSSIVAIAENSALKRIVLIADDFIADDFDASHSALKNLPCISWRKYIEPFEVETIAFNRMPYDAPLAILFSSGTTGKPKCIVHSAMGLLLQHNKELVLHCDIKPGEKFFYFTTCGWMMWNWQVSGLAVGATLVTYDGNPFYPSPDTLFELIEKENINVFGTSAKFISACQNTGLEPGNDHKLDSLRLILSTGSPLLPNSFDYVYQHWKPDAQLASISGGTDICGCFMGGNPLLPVYSGELQCALLGMDLDIFDTIGNSVNGVSGELICRNSHLSVPLGFWGDSGELFYDAYFKRFPGHWAHGDFVEKRPTGGFVVHGRSDTTLNPGGVRIGTAEIYRQVEQISEVLECIAVGQDWNGDQRVVLFVCLKAGCALNEELKEKIKKQIRKGASPRHVPEVIIAVHDIPRTRSGKISEKSVREAIHGRALENLSSLANPESLEEYKNIKVLQM